MDARYLENFTDAQPIKVDFSFGKVVADDIIEYTLVLTHKLFRVSGAGQRHFDLI